jgi:glycosyltransferase involved in cell wall biosynthesis
MTRKIPADLDLSVVVPALNPGARLKTTIEALVATLTKTDLSFEVLCVSDGSTDGSADTLAGVHVDVVRLLTHEKNQGKGAALRTGFLAARGRYLGFIDADGDLPPDQFENFTALLTKIPLASPKERRKNPLAIDCIVGTKHHEDADVSNRTLRRVTSKVWQQLVGQLFALRIVDTQVGLKLFRRELITAALPLCRERGFAFDLELLVVAQHLGYRRVIEVPVTIAPRTSSTLTGRSTLAMARALVAIWFRLKVTKRYGPLEQQPGAQLPTRSRETAPSIESAES